jgi:hypothetical protein
LVQHLSSFPLKKRGKADIIVIYKRYQGYMLHKHKKTQDFLIRNMPIEIYNTLKEAAEAHHRSMAQEAIVALTNALTTPALRLQKPKPFKWKTKITSKFIDDAIKEGRE